jgi:hypothetical protein
MFTIHLRAALAALLFIDFEAYLCQYGKIMLQAT